VRARARARETRLAGALTLSKRELVQTGNLIAGSGHREKWV